MTSIIPLRVDVLIAMPLILCEMTTVEPRWREQESERRDVTLGSKPYTCSSAGAHGRVALFHVSMCSESH